MAGERRDLLSVCLTLIFISDIVKLLPLALVEDEGPLLMEVKCDETLVEESMEGAGEG
jgi:hypothetical protein